MAKKRKRGRPKEGLGDLLKDLGVEILKEYSEGASDVEIKAMIWEYRGSFSDDLWDRWLREELDFSGTIKRGRMLSRRWWENIGRKNMKDKDFSATLWYMNMKNRFGWADKQETKNEHVGEIKITRRIIE